MRLRTVLLEGHPNTAVAVSSLLTEVMGAQLLAVFNDVPTCLRQLPHLSPVELVVLDLTVGGYPADQVAPRLRAATPQACLVVHSGSDPHLLEQAQEHVDYVVPKGDAGLLAGVLGEVWQR